MPTAPPPTTDIRDASIAERPPCRPAYCPRYKGPSRARSPSDPFPLDPIGPSRPPGTPESARPVSTPERRRRSSNPARRTRRASRPRRRPTTPPSQVFRPKASDRVPEKCRDSQHACHPGQGQARGSRRNREGAGEAWQQRLDAIEHRENHEKLPKHSTKFTRQNHTPRAISGRPPAGVATFKSWRSTSPPLRLAAPAWHKGKTEFESPCCHAWCHK